MRPAPQGRGYRVRKRSNHVTIIVDVKVEETKKEKAVKAKKAVESKTN
jgi:large subunit ribosomal protein L22